jgi:hypothetical protein
LTITKTANLIEPSYPDVSLDILGVKPGMSLDAARKALIANYHVQPASQSASMSLTYRTVNMSSQTYVTSLTVHDKQGGSMKVHFGTPATGNTVVQVDRVIMFPDVKKAPTVAAVRAALDKKYGPESWSDSHGAYLFWAFDKSGHASPCAKNHSCGAGDGCGSASAAIYKRELASGDYVYIQVDVGSSGEDPSRMYSLTIYLNNEADKAISCNAASRQINAAAVAAYKKESTPGAAPKL